MKQRHKGFTLIELMAVIVILGILTTIVAVNVAPFLQRHCLNRRRLYNYMLASSCWLFILINSSGEVRPCVNNSEPI